MKLARPFRILSLSRAEASRAEPHGDMSPAPVVPARKPVVRDSLLHYHPGKVEMMLMTGMK